MILKHGTSSMECSDKLQKARKAIILGTKFVILAIKQPPAVEWEGAEDNAPQHSCVSPLADTFPHSCVMLDSCTIICCIIQCVFLCKFLI